MKIIKQFIQIILIATIMGCGAKKNKLDKYLGTWEDIKEGGTMNIIKEGENFLIVQQGYNDYDGRYVAEIKNDKLQLSYATLTPSFLTVTEDEQTLYFNGDQFRKLTGSKGKYEVPGTKGVVHFKGEGVTESDAKNLGIFLKRQMFFTNEKSASVQLTKEGSNYIVRIVYDKQFYETLVNADYLFKLMGVNASKEVFGGRKVNIALTNKHFEEYKTLIYDEALADNQVNPKNNSSNEQSAPKDKNDFKHQKIKDVDFYWLGISDIEAKSIIDYISATEAFSGGIAELYLTKQVERYIIRFPVIESAQTNESILATIKKVSKQIKDNVFPYNQFSFYVTDQNMRTVKEYNY